MSDFSHAPWGACEVTGPYRGAWIPPVERVDCYYVNQNKAMVVVNSAIIMTYYEIGTIINRRTVWGNKYIERLFDWIWRW